MLSEAGSGTFVAIVGPSGAGKDSLIAYARAQLSGDQKFLFVRRAVTREAERTAEDHESLSLAQFAVAQAQGRFAVTWQAHGLSYGLPMHALDHVRGGGVAIANCSRAALRDIEALFARLQVILVTASPAVLAQRLAARGRESAGEIEKRLLRHVDDFPGLDRAGIIDNSFSLEAGGQALVSILRRL